MNSIYFIHGTKHKMHDGQLYLMDLSYFPEFQQKLEKIKLKIPKNI